MEKHETFYDREAALECMAQHPGAVMTSRPGHPIMFGNRLVYDIPEAQPSWTVWWEKM